MLDQPHIPLVAGLASLWARYLELDPRDCLGADKVVTVPLALARQTADLLSVLSEKDAVPKPVPAPLSAGVAAAGVGPKFSAARCQLMVDLKATGASWAKIKEALNELPGPQLGTLNAVSGMYYYLRERGKLPAQSCSGSAMQKHPAIEDAAPMLVATEPPADKSPPAAARVSHSAHKEPAVAVSVRILERTWSEIETWAAERGMSIDAALTLDMVNRRAERLGVPYRFKVKTWRGSRRA
ncbi:hypothetical protein [Acidocella sp.]|uniref:hypothetical protein n=1 Tax=Acidocella sp. TaxID=50710 RepID=UPI00261DC36C|nr:hypothetical protein [Acidocella sp.]